MATLKEKAQELNPMLDWCDPNEDLEGGGDYVGAAFVLEHPKNELQGNMFEQLDENDNRPRYRAAEWLKKARIEAGKGSQPPNWEITGGAFLLIEKTEDGYLAQLRRSDEGHSEGTKNSLLATSTEADTPRKAVAQLWADVRDACAAWEQWIGFLDYHRRKFEKLPTWAE